MAPSLSGPVAQEYQGLLMDVQRDLLAASRARREGGNGWSTARTASGTTLAPMSSYSHDIFSPVKPTDSQPYPARATVDIPIERPSILTNRPSFPAPFKTSRSIAQPPMLAPSLPAQLQLARTLTRPSISEDRTKMAPPPVRLSVHEEPAEQARVSYRSSIESPAASPVERKEAVVVERPTRRSLIQQSLTTEGMSLLISGRSHARSRQHGRKILLSLLYTL